MKFITIFFLINYFLSNAVINVSALTCSYDGNSCPSAELCSVHCRQLGRDGGYCKWSALEQRCICYCYNDNGVVINSDDLDTFGVMESTKKEQSKDNQIEKFDFELGIRNQTNGPQCQYAASNRCMTWDQCKTGCEQYFPGSTICLLGHPGARTGCCICDISCDSHCEWGWCPCSMGCGCQ